MMNWRIVFCLSFLLLMTMPCFGVDSLLAGLRPAPEAMTRRVIGQFLGTEPCGYFPKGAGWTRPFCTNHVHYAVVSLWVNAIECARSLGDMDLEKRLTDRFLPWFGEKKHLQCSENHVDFCVFGALPYEVYLSTGDKRALELGASYADRQWTLPPKDAPIHHQNLPYDEQTVLFEKGYSPQTRYWIDDMYMIIFLQVQAYRATGDVKYLDRTAKEMVLYLDKLQRADGLFDHAPDVPFVWGRGAGWMAGGMPLLLKYLPETNPDRPRILAGYRKMMAALLKWQRPNGLWGQLVTDPESWDETSGSAMFAYGFVMGVKYGWLDKTTYEPAAQKAWKALCEKVDGNGNLADICCGTTKKNSRDWYLERPRILGLPHGQAPFMWLCAALLERDVDIRDCGARPDGGKCTVAFAQAMERCAAAGGGRIIVPKGRWTTGAIRFRSNCELHLSDGAEVLFTQDPQDYLPAVHTSWEGMECWNYCPLVYAYCCTNVAITGTGTLKAYEGEWKNTAWYPWVWQENGVKAARRQLYDWGAADYPVEKRQIWQMENANTRPHFVQFNRCKGIRWEGFKVRNSPFWTLHLYLCDGATVRRLDVFAHGNNNDGIDIEMSRNVLVEDCVFDQGDDGVVIKSGRNRDGWRLGCPTENVLIRNCRIVNAHTVLGVGSEISGGVRHVRMENCTAETPGCIFYLKTNRRRGGFLEDIVCENVSCREVRRTMFEIDTNVLYEWASFPDYKIDYTRISSIVAKNLRAEQAKRRIRLRGDVHQPPQDILAEDVVAEKVTGRDSEVTNCVRFIDRKTKEK